MRNFQLPGRSPVHSTNAMVSTSQPAATVAGLDVLRNGGNAVDAAVAAAAVLAVVQPSSTGIGGDCFMIYAPGSGEGLLAYDGSGRAPAAASINWFVEHDIDSIDQFTAHAVTVPGAIDAWVRIVEDHGTKGLDALLQPAIACARDGFVVHGRMAHDWRLKAGMLRRDPSTASIFLPGGEAPAAGTTHHQPQLAAALSAIARDGRDVFYEGWIAEDLVTHLRGRGGLHNLDDFAEMRGEYVKPISTHFRGYEVHECPPSSQGIVTLEMLNILSGFQQDDGDPLSVGRLHRLIEAAWIAYGDRNAHLCDPRAHEVPVERLNSQAYADSMRARIRADSATRYAAHFGLSGLAPPKDTIYLCVVDRDGNAVSLIGSLFASFGSGLTGPRSGILLQNRGCGFVLDPKHPNCIAPRKRPLHTIIPGMLTQNGHAVMPFGMLGGDYQPAGQAYLLGNLLEYGLDIQESIDLARVFPTQLSQGTILVEHHLPAKSVGGLKALGHNIVRAQEPIGGANAIWIDRETGVLTGASDCRYDGFAAGY